ncbi:ankyrin repeat-containing domain protein [Mycena albidolilacea]|uniref:Ankyrin repeat-containing domain protein n=1 Tax=Mycena albidolilacea TaxID=1033008 RepID=A0AAD6ZKR5_9AGAR|nr:ankyrin repeat-containing domain protein [Mycena albidolilacea]
MLLRNSRSETVLHIHGGAGGHGGDGREHGIGGAGGAGQGPHVNFRAENVSMHVAVGNDIFSTYQKGTGGWLLEDSHFQQWELNSGGTLWCEGIPGSGKTVLVSMVVDHLNTQAQNRNVGVACIYLNHKDTEVQTVPNLLSGLWRQLVFGKDVTSQVQELYKQHTEKGTRPSLDSIHLALCAAIAQFSKVYIVVDAVDEYPENQRHLLFEHLMEIRSTVNLMITSRPHITPIADSVVLQIRANDKDIQSYIDGYIKRSPQLSKLVKINSELKEKIGTKIRNTVDGMFLLARLHLESLGAKRKPKAVFEALENLPSDLDETYHNAVKRISDQDEEAREIAQSTLIWVTNAKRPLTVEEIRVALAIEPGTNQLDVANMLDIETILSVCAGLIIVDDEHSIVRLVHYTTQEYWDRVQAPRFPNAQTDVTHSLLTFLAFDEHVDIDNWARYADERNQPTLFNYCQYTLVHAAGKPEEDLRNEIIEFLERAVTWGTLAEWERPWYRSAPWEFDEWPQQTTPLWIAAAVNLFTTANYLIEDSTSAGMTKPYHRAAIVASHYGHYKIVELLINKEADVNVQGGKYSTALQTASLNGHKDIAELLINKGADVNAQGGEYGTALQAASSNGHKDIAELLINAGADVNAQDGYYGTALQAASSEGHKEIAELLINNRADVNAQGGEYGTALQTASLNGHKDIAELLINRGADVNVQGGKYSTALQTASLNGHKDIADLLINTGANVNIQGGYYYSTALQAASSQGHKDIAELLINTGADVNAQHRYQGRYYNTARQAESSKGHKDITELLINRGADVNVQDRYYGTALQTASSKGHKDDAELLIDTGPDLNAQGRYYDTALQAALSKGHKDIAELLINKGADVNAQSGYDGTALQEASSKGNKDIAELLINTGANVNAPGGKYGTALQAASSNGHKDIAELLINAGADVNAQDGYYGTALQAASSEGHKEIAELLINRGADVNAQHEYYGTALQRASSKGHKDIAELLINTGADVNVQGGHYGSAFLAASYGGHTKIAELLINKGADVTDPGGHYGTALNLDKSIALSLSIPRTTEGSEELLTLLSILPHQLSDVPNRYDPTALQAASFNGHKDIAELLISRGANVNAQHEYYGTALQAASSKGHKDIAELLINTGADVTAQGGEYGTALQAASSNGHKDIAELLINKGADVNV